MFKLRTSAGHYRLEADGNFAIPSLRDDRLRVTVDRFDRAAADLVIEEVPLERVILPGARVMLLLVVLAIGYLHTLADERLGVKKILERLLVPASVVVAFMLGTVLLQIFYQPSQSPADALLYRGAYLFPPNTTYTFRNLPHITPGIPAGTVEFAVNSEGLRARERNPAQWQSTLSILAIGASTTEGRFLGATEHWPARLEHRLQQGARA